jgi:hypothetical protein
MNESSVCPEENTTTQADLHWQDRLDALVSGHCTEDDFIEEITNLRESSPSSAWDIVALLDQRYRSGQMPADLFRSLESKLTQRELDTADDGMTADLPPSLVHAPLGTSGVAAFGILDRTPPADVSSIPAAPQAPIAPALQIAPVLPAASAVTPTPAAAASPSRSVAAPAPAAAPVTPAAPATAAPIPSQPALPAPAALRADHRSPRQAMETGRVLRDRYTLESRLGSGGMGTVFKASDRFRCDLPESDRHVAIKILHEDINSRPEVLTKLRREFYCAQTLSHKNIVRVYELDRDGDVAFFTMELLEGKSLSAMMKQFHPLPVTRQYAWPIIRDIAAGLVHAHARKVIHGDLKPQNIVITNLGEVRILDFGTSSSPASHRSNPDGAAKSGSVSFTPAYASCELLDGQPADPSDDLYALACLSYELLAGEHPFKNKRSSEARSLGMTPRRPPGLTHRQWAALSMGLAWERKDRSISVRDWIAEINPRSTLLGLLARAGDASPDRASPHPGSLTRRAVPWLGAMLVVLATAWGVTDWRSKPHGDVGGARSAAAAVTAPTHANAAAGGAAPTAANGTAPQASPPSRLEAAATTNRLGAATPASTPAATATAAAKPLAAPGTATALVTTKAPARGLRANLHKEGVNTIEIGARAYAVYPGRNFAEIRVRRSFGFDDDAAFEWWTEPSSAQPGADYVPQLRTAQAFPKGRRGASVFVKIIQNPARKSAREFFVVIGNLSKGNTMGAVSRTAIRLPPSTHGR